MRKYILVVVVVDEVQVECSQNKQFAVAVVVATVFVKNSVKYRPICDNSTPMDAA